MRALVASIEAEYRRYKTLAEDAVNQLADPQLADATGTSNSIATIIWHLAGNLKSRFTNFLTSDGEKPWRDRESEFLPRHVTRADLQAKWEDGWRVLFAALTDLSDADLEETVTIRGQPLTVAAALHRSVAHASYHVGQIVYVAKALRGAEWQYLSIPPGQSAQYNQSPIQDKPRDATMPTGSSTPPPPPPPPPTLYEWVGGMPAIERLMDAFYRKVRQDAVLAPIFAHMNHEHPRHVAHFVGEVLGGPTLYTKERGGHPHMINRHLDRHLTQPQRAQWVRLLLEAADEAGVPDDPEFRSALVAYLEWGSRLAVLNSQPGAAVDPNAPMPHWGWGVPGGPYRG